MCAGDDKTCPEFELHHQIFKETLDHERRSFLKSSFAAAGGAAALTASGISLVTPEMAAAAESHQPAKRAYHHLPANADTVHWGYFSKKLKPRVEIDSGDFITIEALTHHANDDAERMVKGDPGRKACFCGPRRRRASIGVAQVRWMLRCSVAVPGKAWACISSLDRSTSAAPRRATWLSCGSSMSRLGRAPIQNIRVRRLAATRRPGGASTTTICLPNPSRAKSLPSTR